MRLLTLNLRHGGGVRMAGLAERLVAADADVLVLSEYRHNEAAGELHRRLAGAGYLHRRASCHGPRVNGLLVAARRPFRAAPHRLLAFDDLRLLRVRFPEFFLVAAHLPNLKAKIPHWEALLELAAGPRLRHHPHPTVFMGDFNTGLEHEDVEGGPFPFTGAGDMRTLLGMGWSDAWRKVHPDGREFSWYSHRNRGFRLDHAFLSPHCQNRLLGAGFDHEVRTSGLTDHSALWVDLKI